MNIEFSATIAVTDQVIANPQRLLKDGAYHSMVVLSIGDIVLHLPHATAAEVERKIAMAIDAFR